MGSLTPMLYCGKIKNRGVETSTILGSLVLVIYDESGDYAWHPAETSENGYDRTTPLVKNCERWK